MNSSERHLRMTNNHSPNSTERWRELVEEFTSFGGIADNVIQREGSLGLGLFPIDPSKPAELHVPDQLLVATDNLELRDGSIVLKDASHYPKGFGDWYQRFQADYSWGAEAQDSIRTFEEGLKTLPDKVRVLLRNLGVADIASRFSGVNVEQDIFNRFISTRRINRNDRAWLMPMIELVNHSPRQPSWGMSDEGITVKGTYDDEILVRYSVADPLRRLFQYGFNCKEPHGFSARVQVMHRGKTVIIKGAINYKPLSMPNIEINGDTLTINAVMLGSMDQPRVPRSIFRKALTKIEGIEPDELFDQIRQRNQHGLIQVLRGVEYEAGAVIELVRTACRDQLVAIGFHMGSREIPEAWTQTAT